MDVLPDQAGWDLIMPPANQTSVGTDAMIYNVGNFSFTVTDFDGGTIVAIAPGEAQYIYVTDNADEAGTWNVFQFGAGTSSADAAVLAGYGLKALSTTLNQSHSTVTFSSNYTAVAADRASCYIWNGGAGTFTLPAPASFGNDWFVLVRNGGTGSLAVTPASGNINDVASVSLQPADSCFVCCSGTAYFTVGLGKVSQFNFTQLTKLVTTGTYTLTSAEAANVVQKYIGTLSGAVTVEIPQTVQVYYISNQTTDPGPYDITFTTGVAGSATAVVPAGNQVILSCDSVNIYNATTISAGATSSSLSDGTVVNPSLNFASESNTGMYRPGSGEIGWSVLGVNEMTLAASGLTIPSGIAGGVFT